MGFDEKTLSKLEELQRKCERDGQDINNYLDGLINADYLTYWNYIKLDTLLSIQNTLTNSPDEKVFLVYHQITELLFKLCLHELEQVASIEEKDINPPLFKNKLERLIRYFEILTDSFRIMYEGLDSEQFRKFRMALHPASGFQSVQFRKIEILSTDLRNLLSHYFVDKNKEIDHLSPEELYQHLYWKEGALNKETGVKSITLTRFEEKYDVELMDWVKNYQNRNLLRQYLRVSDNDAEIKTLLKKYDYIVNVQWGQIHFKVAERHLDLNNRGVYATGGTNWKKYLRPSIRKRIFYPHFWTEEEKQSWGN